MGPRVRARASSAIWRTWVVQPPANEKKVLTINVENAPSEPPYLNELLPGVKLVDHHVHQVFKAGQGDVQLAWRTYVGIGWEELVSTLFDELDNIKGGMEGAQGVGASPHGDVQDIGGGLA